MQDVVIVGAGAAGIGCGAMLRQLGVEKFVLVDREHTGATFDRWPKEMRFITPSFTSNAFGMLDLNAIAPATSPAYTLKTEHPTGREYAAYLRGVKDYYRLPVRRGVDVTGVDVLKGKFRLETSKGAIYTRFLIWATGEFQYPNLNPFPGADLCLHTSRVSSWKEVKAGEHVVIGGYESGADSAVHLADNGSSVILLDGGDPWTMRESDPSVALSPYTSQRLANVDAVLRLGNFRVTKVSKPNGHYEVQAESGDLLKTTHPPLLATGFAGGLGSISHLIEWSENGDVRLTENDESTLVPGLFVTGPQLRHDRIIFCFIYKFRQRFAVVGRALAERLQLSQEPLEAYRDAGMFLEDLRCCKAECRC